MGDKYSLYKSDIKWRDRGDEFWFHGLSWQSKENEMPRQKWKLHSIMRKSKNKKIIVKINDSI